MRITSEPGLGFSFSDYRAALEAYQDAGYRISGFGGFLDDPQDKHLIMRHDCDNSLDQALRMAEIDAAQGCSATYFVRVHARGYNLLSLPSMQALRRLESLGMEVELHLEAGIPEVLGIAVDTFADRQKMIFEAAVDRACTGLSSHEPARMGQLDFAGSLVRRWGLRYHAYEDRFTTPVVKYLSDSSATWREGHFRLWVDREPRLQVLTHPIWWFDQVPQENQLPHR